MRMKLFRAPDMAGAMACVRAELGVEALILNSRRTRDGVEITAALEPEVIHASLPPLAQVASPGPEPARRGLLRHHGIPPDLRDALEDPDLSGALAATLRFGALDFSATAAPVLVVGPPGAGKTLTIARLATRLVMAGAMPMVITADGRRAGATEQLCAFTRLLGADLVVASHPVTLARAVAARHPGAPVLIDTPGIDAFDPVQREEIAGLAAASGATPVLVLPAGLDVDESTDMAAAAASIGARHLIGTRFDLARRLGGIVAAAADGLTLVEAGIGPGAADGLVPMTADFLATQLLAKQPQSMERHVA
jgi:flagellar biosynthesis protein FlhF